MPFVSDDDPFWRVPEIPAGLLDAPTSGDEDAPWWVHQDVPDVEVPEIPAWLLEAPPSNEPPCGCSCCLSEEPLVAFNFHHAPDKLVDVFKAEWSRVQRHTARMWQALAAMHDAAGPAQAEFVADDVALITNTHPRTGLHLLLTGVNASAAPGLVALVERGEIGSKHAEALLEEAGRWTDTDAQRDEVIALTIERCRRNVAGGGSWPTPGELKKRLRTQALLLDLTAAEQAKKRVSQRRSVELMQTAIGQAQVTVSGPEVSVVQMMDAIRARAEALGRLPGDDRSQQQRMFDAAHELLLVDGAGGESVVPTIDDQTQPVTLTVRGVELAVVMPYSVGLGGDQELAEIVGLGPILPSTARELAAQAVSVRRVAVDADTGRVLAVDDKVPGSGHPGRQSEPVVAVRADGLEPPRDDDPHPDGGGAEPVDIPGSPGPTSGSATVPHPERSTSDDACPGTPLAALLAKVAATPVVHRDLNSSRYRIPGRLRRFVEHRDRTCTFPGCTLPGRWCDVDHREPWPYGETSPENCHCLCRRHHRAKQVYFTVTLDQRTGDTVWTTPDGRTYRRPPPAF